MIDTSQVTLVIPHLGGTQESEYSVRECLSSLRETVPDIKRILAINGNSCWERNGICHEEENFIVISEQGQCKAVNTAVQLSSTPWVLVTNDDMIYPPSWFENLTDSDWGMCVSPQLVEPRPGAPTFETFFCGGAGGDFDKQKFLTYLENYQNVEMVRNGFNLPFLIKRELWDLIGGYDINYDPWGSNGDSDLEYKIKLAGVQPKQNTSAKVYHFSQTSGTFEPKNNKFWQENFAYFERKWGFPRTDEGIWEALFQIPKPPQRTFTPRWEEAYSLPVERLSSN